MPSCNDIDSPVCYVMKKRFVIIFWKRVKLYLFGKLRTYTNTGTIFAFFSPMSSYVFSRHNFRFYGFSRLHVRQCNFLNRCKNKKSFYDQNARVLKIWAKPEVPFFSYGRLNTGLNDIFVTFVRISFVEKTQTNLTQTPYKYLRERLEKGFVLYLNKYIWPSISRSFERSSLFKNYGVE